LTLASLPARLYEQPEISPLERCEDLEVADILRVIGLAASPISELRGAVPLGILTFDMEWYQVLPLAIIGNLLPVPFILLFIEPITRWLSRVAFFERIISAVFRMTRRRGRLIERYERIGLVLFVAIPLPITGAWTGSLAAVLLGLRFRYALVSVVLGVLIAGGVVTAATMLGWSIFAGDAG
jgi:uncharacterized membrane protein